MVTKVSGTGLTGITEEIYEILKCQKFVVFLLSSLNEMTLEVLVHHPECLDLLLPKNLSHLCIRSEELLVLRVLELLLLDVGPDALDHLGPAELFILGNAHEGCQGGGEAERLSHSL